MLKKILSILTAWFCLLGAWCVNNRPLFLDFGNEYEIYSMANGSNAKIECANSNSYYTFALKYGESCSLSASEFCQKRFLNQYNARLIFTEQASHGTSVYAYSPQIKYCAYIKGEKVNLHFFIGEQAVKVGSPIIFGSY